jgi:hypothetical protein
MYLCYVDESGTPDVPGNTSHFILAGVAIPIKSWKSYDKQISLIKQKFQLGDAEIHTGWLARPYSEQKAIPEFDKLSEIDRRRRVESLRAKKLLELQKKKDGRKQYQQARKTYKHTAPYIHLTLAERTDFLRAIADCVGGWNTAKLFAECIDKVHFTGLKNPLSIDEQAFEQVITRLEAYLENTKPRELREAGEANFCLVIHDNNQTTALKHTKMMIRFHRRGTFFRDIANIIETPLFVDSALTGMIQIADLCAYAIRRYCENGDGDLFNRVFKIADKTPRGIVVGARHFSKRDCSCIICVGHRKPVLPATA